MALDDSSWYIELQITDSPLGNFVLTNKYVILVGINTWSSSCKINIKWMSYDLIDDKLTLCLVEVSGHQATSRYLFHCWLRYVMPYGATGSQWVNIFLDLLYQDAGCSEKELTWHYNRISTKHYSIGSRLWVSIGSDNGIPSIKTNITITTQTTFTSMF